MDEKFLLKCFLTYLKSCEKELLELYDFFICVQKNSKNKVESCHKILIHKVFFTQIRNIAYLNQQPNEIKILYEDITKNYDKGKLKLLAKEKIIIKFIFTININSLIRDDGVMIQNSKVQQFWTDIAHFEEDKSNSSNDFIQRDILDPFYCLTIDLFHDYNLWKCVLGTNFSQIKFADHSNSITLNNIHKINHATQQSFEDFNTQNPFIDNPDILVDCSPCLNLTLEDEISDKTKSSINEILHSWPEHPTYCSLECKSHFFESSINDNREISDNQIFDQFSLENRQSSDLEKSEGVIISKKKYRKKVDIAISYRIYKGINEKERKTMDIFILYWEK
ncbi:hypothetical protein F8M41_001178 [Gigaspora margarita]|uniref:Uncharacterized protein n=1 Tax=Gigaspora margarita TaxID=4874 RepID=A0A8H3XGC9_GIGMA|nr:hypothetical protein F8M41_001178 [Gigaspora margarita]